MMRNRENMTLFNMEKPRKDYFTAPERHALESARHWLEELQNPETSSNQRDFLHHEVVTNIIPELIQIRDNEELKQKLKDEVDLLIKELHQAVPDAYEPGNK